MTPCKHGKSALLLDFNSGTVSWDKLGKNLERAHPIDYKSKIGPAVRSLCCASFLSSIKEI